MIRSIRIAFCCSLALLAFAATASATNYCVGAGVSCDQTFPQTEAGFNTAIAAYESGDIADDTFYVAEGIIEFSSPLAITYDPSRGHVRVAGAGSGKTKLIFRDVGSYAAYMNLSDESEFNGVSIESLGTSPSRMSGLGLADANAEDVYVYVAQGMDATAFEFWGSPRCLSCRAKVSGESATGFLAAADSSAYIEDGRAEVYDPDPLVPTRGVSVLDESASIELNRTKLVGFNRGVFQNLGTVRIDNSLIDLKGQENAVGMALDTASTIDAGFLTQVDAVSIVGTGVAQSGISLRSHGAGTGSIEVEVQNSLIWLTGSSTEELACWESDPANVSILFTARYSMAQDELEDGCAISQSDMVTGAPTFVDFGAGDYRPAAGSPVIDAGDPFSSGLGPFDLWGGTRYINGSDFKSSGDVDLGAGEYQNYAPNKPVVSASATAVAVGEVVTFSASGSDPNNDPVSFTWEFHEGGAADGASTQRSYGAPGVYKAKAIASDGEFTRASSWIEVTVTTPLPDPFIQLGKATGKFKYSKKKIKPFALGTATSKSRIPVTTNFAGEVTLTLTKRKGGYKSGKKCSAKKPKKGMKAKRCDLKLKGSQKLTLPVGQSFLTFGGKWGKSALPTGSYLLSVTGGDGRHDVALNAIRNMK